VYCNYLYGIKTTLFMVVNADCFCICSGCDDFRGDSFHVPCTLEQNAKSNWEGHEMRRETDGKRNVEQNVDRNVDRSF
jgi:hypothetical protein